MEEKRRRNDNNPYGISVVGDGIPMPDYANFKALCNEVGKELGISGREVYKTYHRFIDKSVELLIPERSPKELSDDELLNPRRAMLIPYVGAAEVTKKSLSHFRKVMALVEESKRKKNKYTDNSE